MSDFDPFGLAARQVEFDRAATQRFPILFERKKQRLSSSPHALLRGSAKLFYEILAKRSDLSAGPPAEGWIVGDMHLENVGAYRNDADDVVFGLNDFDDATVGPLRLDVLRLSTSVILVSRGLRAPAAQAIALAERTIQGYLGGLTEVGALPMPAPVKELVDRAKARSKKALLDARAPLEHGQRRFARGARYLDLPANLAARVPELMAAYAAALAKPPHEWTIEDSAQRIAGNGSLGVMRIAVLVRDPDGEEHLLELKECGPSSTEGLFASPAGRWHHPAERCTLAARALVVSPPRKLAPVALGDLSFSGRRLFPQEDKLDIDGMSHAGGRFEELVPFIGQTLGAAHARGAAALGASRPTDWSTNDVAAVVDHAVELAGMMEWIYLAFGRRNP